MALWVLTLFFLGLLAVIFNLMNIFSWYVPWWGSILMILALGMLVRIWRKEKEGERERLIHKIRELEEKVSDSKMQVKL
jgi:membrane protein implicated in regulation of membrane protease activity